MHSEQFENSAAAEPSIRSRRNSHTTADDDEIQLLHAELSSYQKKVSLAQCVFHSLAPAQVAHTQKRIQEQKALARAAKVEELEKQCTGVSQSITEHSKQRVRPTRVCSFEMKRIITKPASNARFACSTGSHASSSSGSGIAVTATGMFESSLASFTHIFAS